MQNPQNSSQVSVEQDVRGMFNLACYLIDSWTLPIEVMIRHGFGARYLNHQCVVGLVMISLVGVTYPTENQLLLTIFFWAAVVMMFRERGQAKTARKQGKLVHSYYPGTSRLPASKNGKPLTGFEEAVFVGMVGFPLSYLEKPLGTYLLIGAFCLAVKASMSRTYFDQRAQDLEDARISAEVLARRTQPFRYERS
jgi:hypothetical protein